MMTLNLQINPSFFLPEERNGFDVSSERKRIWAVELDLLNEFSGVCKKYQLKWFAHAGTMLGAVRHHGFIPWDDDIDVVMPREDYERLCEIGPSAFSHPYFYQNECTDPYYARAFSRLRNSDTTAIFESERAYRYPYNQGIFLDIFPIDHVPADPDDRKRYYDEVADLNAHAVQWRTLIHFYRPKTGKGLGKRVSYWLKHLYYRYFSKTGYLSFMERHHAAITKYDHLETGWVGESIVPRLGRHLWRTEWVRETVMMPFEMLSVPVPVHYDECLAASFGVDWRTPMQVPNLHEGTFFDTEKPYTVYLAQK